MYFLHTIEEGDEAEGLRQEPEEGGRKESPHERKFNKIITYDMNVELMERHCGPSGIGKPRQKTDSESYEATLAYSEKEPVSQEKRGDHNSSTGLAQVASKYLPKPHDEPGQRLISSSPRSSSAANRRSSSTSQSSRRMTSSTPGSSQRRTTSVLGSPSSNAPREVSRRSSAEDMIGPVLGKRGARKEKAAPPKRTGKKAPRRDAARRRRRTHPTPEHDDLPAPQWVINLMFDIEEATKHELTVEYK